MSGFKKFEIKDKEHLISVLNSIMPIQKDMAILNIRKYGYQDEEAEILKKIGFK